MKRAIFAVCVFLCSVSMLFAEETKLKYPLSVVGPKAPDLENPPERAEIIKAIGRSVAFLIETQKQNGSWGGPNRTKRLNIYAPTLSALEAYQAGASGLALASLLEVLQKSKTEFTFEELDVNRTQLVEAVDRGEEWMLTYLPKLRRSSPDVLYNVWGHAYGIRALVRMMDRFPEDKERIEKIRKVMQGQVDLLERFEMLSGGWGYYDQNYKTQKSAGHSCCFVSATVLLALKEAETAGAVVPKRIVDRAVASILMQRRGDFSYCYGDYLALRPMLNVNTPPGSLGRSQACNLALQHWGGNDVSQDVHRAWLERIFARNGWIDVGRKRPIPHESFFQVAGYFFYYAHFYAAFCIEELPEAQRAKYKALNAAVLLPLQEKDGSFWDYPLYDYHQQYGTGYAIMSLLRAI